MILDIPGESNLNLTVERLNYENLVSKHTLEKFALDHSLPVEYIKSLDPDQRNSLLIEELFTQDELDSLSPNRYPGYPAEEESLHNEFGLLIIKPEIFPHINKVGSFLRDRGIEYELLSPIIPTKQQWLDTYGYMVKDYPSVVNVYITQTNFGLRPIIFRHLDMEDYHQYANRRGIILDSNDKDAAFDKIFCGKASPEHADTIRGDVVFPSLIELGFVQMDGYAGAFDPFNFYMDSHPAKTFISFSGIHIPKDCHEKAKNLLTYTEKVNNEAQ